LALQECRVLLSSHQDILPPPAAPDLQRPCLIDTG
jgi:hypothetical protein